MSKQYVGLMQVVEIHHYLHVEGCVVADHRDLRVSYGTMEVPAPKPPRKATSDSLVKDGVMEIPESEFQTFPSVARMHTTNRGQTTVKVSIPVQVWRALKLKKHDLLQVAIRKISLNEAVDLFHVSKVERKGKHVLSAVKGGDSSN